MEFSQDWKSLFPIYSTLTSPLLLSGQNAKQSLGPLLFNPVNDSLTLLFSVSTTSLISPSPHLSLSRFLTTSMYVPPSTSVAIADAMGPLPHNHVNPLARNRLCLLHCPLNNYVFSFFPTGVNSNHMGFSVFCLRDRCLDVLFDKGGVFHTADTGSTRPILKIVANPVADIDLQNENSGLAHNGYVAVGYLLACTMCSVHWFEVRIMALSSELEKPVLAYLGKKVFRSCPVVDACWSPHLEEQSVVLLESGELFLFDLESCLKNSGLNASSKGTKLRVTWDNSASKIMCKWLAVDFSWHPQILIVARSDAVFVVDLRDDESTVSCLMKIDMMGRYSSVESDCFLAFCKAGSDGFHFTLASRNMLILCDARKPLMPVLQWDHCLEEPCYIDVFRLSELRSHSLVDTFKWASECGFGIILGSLWSGEFSLFCYGPPLPSRIGSFASKLPKFYESLYAWGLPSGISLSGRDCWCGSCLMKEEFMKNTIPEWIDWQQKKELVLGFGILSKNAPTSLAATHEFGGFTMVRLMSSGKFESQRYCASWELVKKLEEAHQKSSLCFENNFLCSMADEEYKFPRRFKYLELDYLYGYLNRNLGEVFHSNFNNPAKGTRKQKSFNSGSHEILCEKLKACRSIQLGSVGPDVTYTDVIMSTSVREVALRRMWMNLPVGLLQLAFSSYPEFMEVLVDRNKGCLEFLPVPDLAQLPPFFLRKFPSRSNKWSNKVPQPANENVLVGPVVPLPILLLLCELHSGDPNARDICSAEKMDVDLHCEEVMQDVKKMGISDASYEIHAVELGDDRPETMTHSQEPKPFVLYHTAEFNCPTMDEMQDDSFRTLICKVPEKEIGDRLGEETVGDLFDSLSPMVLKFDDDDSVANFGVHELEAYNLLKNHYSKWKQGFD